MMQRELLVECIVCMCTVDVLELDRGLASVQVLTVLLDVTGAMHPCPRRLPLNPSRLP